MPVDPGPSSWHFPSLAEIEQGAVEFGRRFPGRPAESELVAVGADLDPATLLAAYRAGLFPMPVTRGRVGWWSPDPRGIIPLDGLQVSRSLRRSCRRFTVTIDTAFDVVVEACADRRRPGAWIDRNIKRAYRQLFEMGWVHSVEAWDEEGALVGGLYGLAIGGLFAGESMFHRRSDASKVALVALVERLRGGGALLLDVQWVTPHLAGLGAVEVPRASYHELLAAALAATVDPWMWLGST